MKTGNDGKVRLRIIYVDWNLWSTGDLINLVKVKDKIPEYATRQTAIGLVDPWISHKMDRDLASKVKIKEPTPFRTP